jgi:hypothetical protein
MRRRLSGLRKQKLQLLSSVLIRRQNEEAKLELSLTQPENLQLLSCAQTLAERNEQRD